MKVPVLILFLLLSFTIKGVTSEPESTHTSNQSIDRLIQKVKKSSGDDRRKAMNALKLKLRSVNQATRAHTMSQLKKAFHHTGTPTHTTAVQAPKQHLHQGAGQGQMRQHGLRTPTGSPSNGGGRQKGRP
jgi:hypothetical protein